MAWGQGYHNPSCSLSGVSLVFFVGVFFLPPLPSTQSLESRENGGAEGVRREGEVVEGVEGHHDNVDVCCLQNLGDC